MTSADRTVIKRRFRQYSLYELMLPSGTIPSEVALLKRCVAETEKLMSQLVLPACVETRDDGKIVVRGHRVSLHLILDAHYSGQSIDEIHDEYPTVPLDAIREIVEFCNENDDAMRQFYVEHEAERQRIANTIETPDLNRLRQRKP